MLLSVNIDHIATIRNARNSLYPSLIRAAEIVRFAGACAITVHLREDRRHIRDSDVADLAQAAVLPMNLEVAATPEMLGIALKYRPKYVCIVPEKRQELTTEGGLDVAGNKAYLRGFIRELSACGAEVSVFIEPLPEQISAAKECGAQTVELHTGKYAENLDPAEFERISEMAKYAKSLGLNVHAGHGLTFESLEKIAEIREISFVHIGHFIITESIFTGLFDVVKKMVKICLEK